MATFSCSFSSITDSSAKFNGSFTGGDSSYSRNRYVLLVIDGVGEYQITSSSVGGDSSSFSKTINGLDPDTTYYWGATLGYIENDEIIWTDYIDSGRFTTDSLFINVSPWSWTSSNGNATSTQTRNFYKVLIGDLPANSSYISCDVWNDLVDKVDELLNAYGMTWDDTYATRTKTKISSGQTLSAIKFNSVRKNLHSIKSSGVSKVNAGDEIKGSYFTKLTDTINSIIEG